MHTQCSEKVHKLVNLINETSEEEVINVLQHLSSANLYFIINFISIILLNRDKDAKELLENLKTESETDLNKSNVVSINKSVSH